MRRIAVLMLSAIALAAPARAVTFTQVTHCCTPQEFGVGQPAWSSNANKIAATFANDYLGYEFFVGIAAFTPDGVFLPGYSPNANFLERASWAPDAMRYACQIGGLDWLPAGSGLFIVDADGAHSELALGPYAEPAWSPDGGTIAFTDVADGNIWSMPPSGGAPIRITTTGGAQPAWTPDGTAIVYAHGGDLWKIDAGGGVPVQLTDDPGVDTHPACSPNGLWIAFTSDRSGNADLFVMSMGGGAAIQLTTDSALDRAPTWAPGSDRIAFESTRSGHLNIWIASNLPDFTVGVERPTWTALKQLYRAPSR